MSAILTGPLIMRLLRIPENRAFVYRSEPALPRLTGVMGRILNPFIRG